jgi:hypothetical protein
MSDSAPQGAEELFPFFSAMGRIDGANACVMARLSVNPTTRLCVIEILDS